MTLVLIVDDVSAMAEQYAYDLKRLRGYETLVAKSGREALDELAREPVDCVILDLEMPGMDGFEVLRSVERLGLRVPVIVYTGTGNYDRCVQAIRLGAHGFIDKAEPMERVAQEVESAIERRRLVEQVAALRRGFGVDSPLVGASSALTKLKEAIARVAPVPSTVLIVGESGTGKELVARELHRLGTAPKGPFVALNSAALPQELIESELFGHERGAFTGASATRKGAFEVASGGTLLLDEVGDLPAAAQAKLLRVLEERQVTRLGGSRSIAVDARVVAATHRDLEKEVGEGRFREDLYYRLNVHVLRVPPLRERLSDVPALVDHLLAATCGRFGVPAKTLAADALACLMAYDWRRNNVRELRNVVERMVIATDREELTRDDVPAEIRNHKGVVQHTAHRAPRTFEEQKAEAERQIVVAALERHDWHITNTAKELGLADHASLLKIMRRLGVARP
ncbi:MAG TPA: sigma-54 dependent transcriptional regulator [Gemmatimonadales bacterium]|jgi:two-component system nitrogen regulation response regulator NtrX|nr:sigma-54 dependent transcriptional regulator [Gemmatimonadales bacterium]